jgi:hypothetical protein
MTMTLNTKTAAKNEAISKQAIEMINSLGGPPIGYTNSMEHLQVSLENHAAAQIPVWSLNVLEQTLKRQGFKAEVTRVKTNRYMSMD